MSLTKAEIIIQEIGRRALLVAPVDYPSEDGYEKEHSIRMAKQYEIHRLGGLKAYEQFTFEKYTNKSAIDKCAGFPNNNLYIWGKSGTGKTHLATAIIRGMPNATVYKPAHIFRKLRMKDGAEEQSIIDGIAKMPVLLIDDLGVEKKTDFSISMLYEIIEQRDMNYQKGLIVTSNLSLGALAERIGDDRICSRLAGMCKIIELTGEDHRIKNTL